MARVLRRDGAPLVATMPRVRRDPVAWSYAEALYLDTSATLADVREAVATLEDTERTARRVLGGAHPTVVDVERALRNARAALRARETPSPPTPSSESV